MFNHSFRMVLDHVLEAFEHGTAGITGIMEVLFHIGSLPRHFDLLCVHNNDEISGIHIWRKDRFVLSTKDFCHLCCNSPKSLPLSIDEIPLLFDFTLFKKICAFISKSHSNLHVSKFKIIQFLNLRQNQRKSKIFFSKITMRVSRGFPESALLPA